MIRPENLGTTKGRMVRRVGTRYRGSEINDVSGNLDATDPAVDRRGPRDRRSHVVLLGHIIRNGDLNGADLPDWPAFDPAGTTVMRLGDQWKPIPVATPEKIEVWKRYLAMQVAW